MSKKSAAKKQLKSGLSQTEKELGKTRLMIIFAMIVAGLAIAIYTTH